MLHPQKGLFIKIQINNLTLLPLPLNPEYKYVKYFLFVSSVYKDSILR